MKLKCIYESSLSAPNVIQKMKEEKAKGHTVIVHNGEVKIYQRQCSIAEYQCFIGLTGV